MQWRQQYIRKRREDRQAKAKVSHFRSISYSCSDLCPSWQGEEKLQERTGKTRLDRSKLKSKALLLGLEPDDVEDISPLPEPLEVVWINIQVD